MKEIICLYYIVVLVLKTEIILKCIGRNAVFYDANGRMVDVLGIKECRGVPSMMSSVNIRETIVEYELD